MFNMKVSRHDFPALVLSIGCADMAKLAKDALATRGYAVEDLPDGEPPSRTDEERHRATALIGQVFGH